MPGAATWRLVGSRRTRAGPAIERGGRRVAGDVIGAEVAAQRPILESLTSRPAPNPVTGRVQDSLQETCQKVAGQNGCAYVVCHRTVRGRFDEDRIRLPRLECGEDCRQSTVVAASDAADRDLIDFLDDALEDIGPQATSARVNGPSFKTPCRPALPGDVQRRIE